MNKYEFRTEIKERILHTYEYGSRVYGTNTKDSDYDFQIIIDSDEDIQYNVKYPNCDFIVYSEPLFIKKIKEHHIDVLECIFQKKNDPYLQFFKLDKSKLRRAISSVSSNSFVKGKKKFDEEEYYIGKKSLFHSLRILGFGTQIALSGRIIDYSAYNHYLERIMEMDSDNWEIYKKIFKNEYNRMKSNFKKFAPLGE